MKLFAKKLKLKKEKKQDEISRLWMKQIQNYRYVIFSIQYMDEC